MRLFSIIAAVLVAVVMYMWIIERPLLWQVLGMSDDAETQAQDADGTAPESAAATDTGDLVKVVVQRSTAQQVDSAVVLRGQTAAVRQVEVRAETTAVVASEPLRKGAQVDVGQILCELAPGTRQAALAEAQARLSEAESRVPEAEARLEEAKAALDEANINQTAASRLITEGYASQTRLASTQAAVASAKAGVSSAEAGLRASRAGIEAAEAEVAIAEKEIGWLTIRAPFSGLLENDTAELGSLLQSGGLCATIIQLDPVKLVAYVPETEVNRVVVGAHAGARLAAGGREITGKVNFLARSADPATRTFEVEISVPNEDLSILDGQTVEIAISSAGVKAHILPQSALTLNDDGTLGVRAVDEAAKVLFYPVEMLRDTPQGVWLAGLPDEIQVIVLGQEYVTAGVTVAPTLREVTQ